MEQKCFLRLLREGEGQMSLIKADLLRAAKWKSEPVQLPVSAREEPGLGSRLGGESRSPSASSGCWAH